MDRGSWIVFSENVNYELSEPLCTGLVTIPFTLYSFCHYFLNAVLRSRSSVQLQLPRRHPFISFPPFPKFTLPSSVIVRLLFSFIFKLFFPKLFHPVSMERCKTRRPDYHIRPELNYIKSNQIGLDRIGFGFGLSVFSRRTCSAS